MVNDILDKFIRQANGKWMAEMKGCKCTLKVTNSDPSYYWMKVYLVKPGEARSLHKTVMGNICKVELDIPVTYTIQVETERKPSAATVDVYAENFVESVVNGMVSGEGDAPSLESLQRQINEQKAVNDEQQEELERNASLDREQQEQIEKNRETNEAQERGIGEEAVNEMVKKVFGE